MCAPLVPKKALRMPKRRQKGVLNTHAIVRWDHQKFRHREASWGCWSCLVLMNSWPTALETIDQDWVRPTVCCWRLYLKYLLKNKGQTHTHPPIQSFLSSGKTPPPPSGVQILLILLVITALMETFLTWCLGSYMVHFLSLYMAHTFLIYWLLHKNDCFVYKC